MTETFGQRMRRLRREQGFTVVDLARAVGASEGTIRQIESGSVKSPSFHFGIRIAEALRADPRYLALGEGQSVAERFESLEARFTKLENRLANVERRR